MRTVIWNLSDFRCELVICIKFCVLVLCVDYCITLESAAALVYFCCVYCEENTIIRNEVFYLHNHIYGIHIHFMW